MVVTAALLAAMAFLSFRPAPVGSTGEVSRLSINPPPRTVFTALNGATVPTPQFAASPDGRSIAFIASSDELSSMLWLRALDDVDARVLPGTEGAQEPFSCSPSRPTWISGSLPTKRAWRRR